MESHPLDGWWDSLTTPGSPNAQFGFATADELRIGTPLAHSPEREVQYPNPLNQEPTDLRLFPLYLKLRGRRCLVVGGGKISEGKIAGLLESGAKVTVVAPQVTPQIASWHQNEKISWKRKKFRSGDLDGIFLVVAATNSNQVQRSIYRTARTRKILCNIVDVPQLCDFYYPAVVRRGHLQIAISTAGASPSLARRLREEMEATFGPEYAAWLKHLARERKKLLAKKLPTAKRVPLLKDQASRKAFSRFLRANRKADR